MLESYCLLHNMTVYQKYCWKFSILISFFMACVLLFITRNYKFVIQPKYSTTEDVPHGDKWIVISTNSSTFNETILSEIKNWKVVIVGMRRPAVSYSCSRVCYINALENSVLGQQEDVFDLPYYHTMFGYLFAIEHGAKAIYNIVDDLLLSQRLQDNILRALESIYRQSQHKDYEDANIELQQYNKGKNPIKTIRILSLDQVQFSKEKNSVESIVLQSENTFLTYREFWAYAFSVPISNTFTEIVRALWIKQLYEELGTNVEGTIINTIHSQNIPNNNLTLLKTLLNSWNCPVENSFFECMDYLGAEMLTYNLISDLDMRLYKAWLMQLIQSNYIQPVRTPKPKPDERLSKLRSVFKPICGEGIMYVPENKFRSVYDNILLVIIFNFPLYDNIIYLDSLYKTRFSKIVYCGSQKRKFQNAQKSLTTKLDFIEMAVNKGYFGYKCTSAAMKLNHDSDVVGYLTVGDDVLLNVWNLQTLPFDKLWTYSTSPLYHAIPNKWYWWDKPMGQREFRKAWSQLQNLKKTDKVMEKNISKFIQTLEENTGSKLGLMHGWSDINYVPKRLSGNVIYFFDFFAKYNVFLEIVIATVFNGVSKASDTVRLKGHYLWNEEREGYASFYNSSDIFLHPMKLSLLKSTLKDFYCKKYLPLWIAN